jgi:hypothetical protein
MNRTIARAAAITLAGLAVLGPAAAASADPSVSIKVDGQPYVTGGSGSLGQALHADGAACANPTPGEPAYMGEFALPGGDPWTDPGWHVVEGQTDEAGNFTWDITIELDSVGQFGARWYCATAPIESLSDPAVLWVGPLMTMTITDGSAGAQGVKAPTVQMKRTTAAIADDAQTQSLRKVAVRGSQILSGAGFTASGPEGVTVTVDPDSMPAIDRVNIPGDVTAELKARVDARSQQGSEYRNNKASNDTDGYSHRENAAYVAYAFRALTGRNVGAAVSAPFVDRLDAGEIRSAVVEDIALTAHGVGYWTTLG